MGLPNVIIEFKGLSTSAIKRGERGVVAILLVDTPVGVSKVSDITAIPKELTDANKAYVSRAFIGGYNPVKHIMLVVSDTIENGLKLLESTAFDYVVAPPDVTSEDAGTIAIFIKGLRDNKGIKVKAVLPNTSADHEGIINFTTTDIAVGKTTFTAAEYCSRMAGLLAGTPLQVSATFCPLSEVDDVPKFTKTELDAKINAGEFLIWHDGDKVKTGRAVNSLVTLTSEKGEDYQYTKIIDTMDLTYKDIKKTCEDSYIGKYPNNYDNKVNLIVAISVYLEGLRDDRLIDTNVSVSVDIQAQTAYLKGKGYDVDNMTIQEIKESNTGTLVFIEARYKILNAIEDISVKLYI